ncbi:MAG: hypothetical protein HKN21_17180 [Candidatus Eisenbacteria bacterium]|uniref:Uncharacterized protein n=1 Tax=Eiseniibacteriota bacterium TaxID=2212470 RepID=A0A7Y2H483_UNCEI|nr:hypothetical protein [Candidatus Eisenbacteria bacterium]
MSRPDGVTMISVWSWIGSLIALLGIGGLAIAMINVWMEAPTDEAIIATVALGMAVLVVIIYGIASLVVGFGLWKLKPWSRGAARVMAILQLIVVPFGTIVGIMMLVYFAKNKNAKIAFGDTIEPDPVDTMPQAT